MKISLNWIKEYLDFELPPVDELVAKIGAQLGAVEEVIDLGARYTGIPIVKVVVCEPLENSDHLHRCLIDDGGAITDVERNEQGLVQAITGAPNVHADMLAVWLPPGITVPESYDKDPFVLTSRPMRGAVSHGMLASAKELSIGDSHEGLLELDPAMVTPSDMEIKPGADFAEVFGLNDTIVDVENKMFTHRPDCFGQLGVAREIAGILGHEFKSPQRYLELDKAASGSGLELSIENEIPGQVPRFMAVALKNIEVKPSPLWLQMLLTKVGAKPINNVVDVTNYMMLLTGQPMHAYDYDKVATGKLAARLAKPGEKLALLNGKTVELDPADMVITNGDRAIGLAGVMGGAETEVNAQTKNIILECASFDMFTIRRTSMRHGLFTDAVTRFNKGQSPLQNPYVLQLAVGHLQILTGGDIASAIVDDDHTGGRTSLHPPVKLPVTFINERLGLALTENDIKKLLENVELQVNIDGETLTVTAPFWRTDVELREDVVEEVGRLYGFDKLPQALPRRDLTPAPKNQLLELKQAIRQRLAEAGANELLTYSFVHGDLLTKTGQDPADAFQIGNALSPDLQYYRLSLVPSLLDKVHANIKAGYDEFALFELGKTHFVGEMDEHEPLAPNEDSHLALVVAAADKKAPAGSAFYLARRYLAHIMPDTAHFVPLTEFDLTNDEWGRQLTAPYEPSRTAVIVKHEQIWGVVGEFRTTVRRSLKLPVFTAGFEMHLDLISSQNPTYVPLPRFPKVSQDITLKVTGDTSYQQLFDCTWQALLKNKPANTTPGSLIPIDIYQKDGEATKNITLRLTIASYERTLTDKEVGKLLDAVSEAAKNQLNAERI